MKRGLLAALCSVAVWLGTVGTASAQDAGFSKPGGLGVGAAVTNRGAPGLSAYFVPVGRVGVQGVLHFESLSGDDTSDSSFGLTVNGMYSLLSDGGFELPALVGLDFTRVSSDPGGGAPTSSTSGLSFLLGVQPAWWPAPEVSFHLTLALLIDLGSSGDDRGVGEGTTIALPGTPEFLGSAAVTFWIK